MQKKIIALAVAGLVSGVAFAQSNVTIYGSLDESYSYSKGKTATGDSRTFSGVTGGQYNGNRIGFKGEEDLGNGLKALFTYEYGTSLEAQGGITNVRQAFVGLGGAWGTVTVGRNYAPSGSFAGRNSAWDIASTSATNNIFTNMGKAGSPLLYASMGTGDSARWNQSISFNSANYSGFSGRAIYAFSNTVGGTDNTIVAGQTYETKTTDNGKLGLSLNYANGPLNLDLIFQSQQNVRKITTSVTPILTNATALTSAAAFEGTGSDINEWYVGGNYDFGVAKVFGLYQTLKNKNNNADANNADFNIWALGVTVPVSAVGKVRAEYARVDFDRNVTASTVNGKTAGYTLGYTHDLSKRTMLYANATRMKNDSDSAALGLNGISGISALGESSTTVTTGVRHFF